MHMNVNIYFMKQTTWTFARAMAFIFKICFYVCMPAFATVAKRQANLFSESRQFVRHALLNKF